MAKCWLLWCISCRQSVKVECLLWQQPSLLVSSFIMVCVGQAHWAAPLILQLLLCAVLETGISVCMFIHYLSVCYPVIDNYHWIFQPSQALPKLIFWRRVSLYSILLMFQRHCPISNISFELMCHCGLYFLLLLIIIYLWGFGVCLCYYSEAQGLLI